MKGIYYTMQGAYGYLVILEILVVCGLSLGLVYLLMRRLLEQTAVVEGMDMGAPVELVVDKSALNELQQKLELTQVELDKTKDLRFKSDEKVKFLESKLLEYEILQEEIGTLSTLKLENEQLRDAVARLEGNQVKIPGDSDRRRERPNAAGVSIDADGKIKLPESAAILPDSSSAPQPMAEAEVETEVDPNAPLITNEDLARLVGEATAQKTAEPKGVQSSAVTEEVSEDSAPQSQDGIDQLIAQIDQLANEATAEDDEKKKTG